MVLHIMWSILANLGFDPPALEGAEGRGVAAALGLCNSHRLVLYENLRVDLAPGRIVLVTGPSGAGKSVLLDQARRQAPRARGLDIDRLARCSLPTISAMGKYPLVDRKRMLSRCGLADARAMTSPARLLSGGQLYRLALARALLKARMSGRDELVIADEFCSVLDEMTAWALCRGVRKLVTNSKVALMLASPREDIIPALEPDCVIAKPLLEQPRVYQAAQLRRRPDWMRNWPIEPGVIGDYHQMSAFHYLDKPPAAHRCVWVIRPPAGRLLSAPSLAAVLVVSPPVLNMRARNIATNNRYVLGDRRRATRMLNNEIECISRVVVHPAFRGCGLAVRLVKHALATAKTPYVEALAAMGTISPFFERSGMKSWVIEQPEHIRRLIATARQNGITPLELAGYTKVQEVIDSATPAGLKLKDELERCAKRTFPAKVRARMPDLLANTCRKTAIQQVYYLGSKS